MVSLSLLDDREHFILTKDGVLLVFNLDVCSRVLADENRVALLHVELDALPVVIELPLADGDDLRLLRFLLCRVRDDDSTAHRLLGILPLDHDAVIKRTELQGGCCSCCRSWCHLRLLLSFLFS